MGLMGSNSSNRLIDEIDRERNGYGIEREEEIERVREIVREAVMDRQGEYDMLLLLEDCRYSNSRSNNSNSSNSSNSSNGSSNPSSFS